MAEIGRVTPGKRIWPDPHEEQPKRDRQGPQREEADELPSLEEQEVPPAGDEQNRDDDGHVDVYV